MPDFLSQLPGTIADLPTVPLAIALAFIFGVCARFINLPPLAGFLLAGFLLNELGVESNAIIKDIAQAGAATRAVGASVMPSGPVGPARGRTRPARRPGAQPAPGWPPGPRGARPDDGGPHEGHAPAVRNTVGAG